MEPNLNGKKLTELTAWFENRPPVVSAVIASRFGLRVLPFVADEPTDGRFSVRQRRQIISSFRYGAIGWLLTKRPSLALDAVGTALNTIAPRTGSAASAAIFEAYAAASSVLSACCGGFFADVAWITGGKDPLDLLDRPTWLNRTPPVVAPEPYLSRWNLMRSALDREDESWKVWTAWYQDRLDGSPPQSNDIEYFRITLIKNSAVKANDTSDEGQRRWQEEIDAIMTLLRSDPQKANRIIAKYIANK